MVLYGSEWTIAVFGKHKLVMIFLNITICDYSHVCALWLGSMTQADRAE